jgi:hypothetical protein
VYSSARVFSGVGIFLSWIPVSRVNRCDNAAIFDNTLDWDDHPWVYLSVTGSPVWRQAISDIASRKGPEVLVDPAEIQRANASRGHPIAVLTIPFIFRQGQAANSNTHRKPNNRCLRRMAGGIRLRICSWASPPKTKTWGRRPPATTGNFYWKCRCSRPPITWSRPSLRATTSSGQRRQRSNSRK